MFKFNMFFHGCYAIWLVLSNCNKVCNVKNLRSITLLWQITHCIIWFWERSIGWLLFTLKKTHIGEFQLWNFKVTCCFHRFVMCNFNVHASTIGTSLRSRNFIPSCGRFSTLMLLLCSTKKSSPLIKVSEILNVQNNLTWRSHQIVIETIAID